MISISTDMIASIGQRGGSRGSDVFVDTVSSSLYDPALDKAMVESPEDEEAKALELKHSLHFSKAKMGDGKEQGGGEEGYRLGKNRTADGGEEAKKESSGNDSTGKPKVAKTKVVKWNVETEAAVQQFVKEEVGESVTVGSCLTTELEGWDDWGREAMELRAPTRSVESSPGGGSKKFLTLQLFVSGSPTTLEVDQTWSVKAVIEKLLQRVGPQPWEDGQMASVPSAFELRMLEEDDGTPDMDMPALDNGREIGKYGVKELVLCPEPSWDRSSSTELAVAQTGVKRLSVSIGGDNGSSKYAGKSFVKVHLDKGSETVVLPVDAEMTVNDLLTVLIKKKRVSGDVPREYYDFTNLEGLPLNMEDVFRTLGIEEMRLLNKMPELATPQLEVGSVNTDLRSVSETKITTEAALAYSEYAVIKTNARGRKQSRILGIDKDTIYNKEERRTTVRTRRISFDTKVSRASRPISSVVSCTMLPGKDQSFQITYHEAKKDITREYKTETKMECQQIVAKIKFLVEYNAKREANGEHASP